MIIQIRVDRIECSVYEMDVNSVNLVLKDNIIMRLFGKNDDFESKIGSDADIMNVEMTTSEPFFFCNYS